MHSVCANVSYRNDNPTRITKLLKADSYCVLLI
jgi:hypothetical protein